MILRIQNRKKSRLVPQREIENWEMFVGIFESIKTNYKKIKLQKKQN